MTPDLDAIVAADEEVRAGLESARAAATARIDAARESARQEREQRIARLVDAAETERRRIEDDGAKAVAERQAARARYSASRRLAADAVLSEAADAYARIVRFGPAPKSP